MIVVIDSGIGGLHILIALKKALPNEEFFYYPDSSFFPYGEKEADAITERIAAIAEEIEELQPKLLILACHTASAHAPTLPIPVINIIDPAVQLIQEDSSIQRIAIMATPATIRSEVYRKKLVPKAVISLPCSGLAELIEQGKDSTPYLEKLLLSQLDVDAILLGCTHYNLIKETIKSFLPNWIKILDPTESLIAHTKQKIL